MTDYGTQPSSGAGTSYRCMLKLLKGFFDCPKYACRVHRIVFGRLQVTHVCVVLQHAICVRGHVCTCTTRHRSMNFRFLVQKPDYKMHKR
jgi:hypothetical protein